MKNILILSIVFLTINCYSQIDFKWENVDSCSKTKFEIYSETKIFIAEKWKSAQNVIQDDDKDAGIIIVKGLQNVYCGKGTFTYSYTVKFLMKDGVRKIIIYNVHYNSSPGGYWDGKDLEPKELYPGVMKTGLYEKSWTTMMVSLKSELQSIFDDYIFHIKSKNTW